MTIPSTMISTALTLIVLYGPQAPGDRPQAPGGKPAALRAALEEAVRLVFADYEVTARYDYVMTGKVRLLLFWIGKDDVGSGVVRLERGVKRPELQAIRLKIGSDPAKAPRRINRWGAATEVVAPSPQTGAVASAFFGFMKDTEGDSVDEVEAELANEAGRHLFKATINLTDLGAASSSVLPIVSPVDFTIAQLEKAERMVLDQYATAFDPARYVELHDERLRCGDGRSFLFTLKAIIDEAVEGAAAPLQRCFLYNSKPYTLALRRAEPQAHARLGFDLVGGERIERTYRDLLAADFEIRNETTGSTSEFELLLGTRGALRGVPVRVVYQPSFWFKAILHLRAASSPHGTFTVDGQVARTGIIGAASVGTVVARRSLGRRGAVQPAQEPVPRAWTERR